MKNLLITPAIILAGLSISTFAIANEYGSEHKADDKAKTEKKAPAKKMAVKKGMEKCYGIAKAGKNDCSAADGKASCAGSAKMDNDDDAFLLVPAGTCDRIAGGIKK